MKLKPIGKHQSMAEIILLFFIIGNVRQSGRFKSAWFCSQNPWLIRTKNNLKLHNLSLIQRIEVNLLCLIQTKPSAWKCASLNVMFMYFFRRVSFPLGECLGKSIYVIWKKNSKRLIFMLRYPQREIIAFYYFIIVNIISSGDCNQAAENWPWTFQRRWMTGLKAGRLNNVYGNDLIKWH